MVPDPNAAALRRLLAHWQATADLRRGRPAGDLIERARAYIAKEPPAISHQHGHDRCFHVACVLVKGFGLTEAQAFAAIQGWNATCDPPWSEAELLHKIADAAKQPGPVGQLAQAGGGNGYYAPPAPASAPLPRPSADTSQDPLDQDATAADLIAASITIQWGWALWLPSGVLSALASEPGVGKTRFCADLARRVYHGLPWPDGSPATFPAGSRTLWVPADNQHAELGTLVGEFGIPPEALYLNATRRNPFAGTMLDGAEDLADFEARIRRVRPALVFVDTALNATDRSSHKPEDAKAFFVPLAQIAARCGVVLVCNTHLNAAGKPLGRRIQGQVRLVMQLEKPDPGQEHRRKVYVVKTHSLYPPALGVTMGTNGNEYDLNPPSAPVADEPGVTAGPKTSAARAWLEARLAGGPKRVGDTRTAAEVEGISEKTLYRAKDLLEVEEYTEDKRKWWRLPTDDIPP